MFKKLFKSKTLESKTHSIISTDYDFEKVVKEVEVANTDSLGRVKHKGLPLNTDDLVPITMINIPDCFRTTPPSTVKVDRKIREYHANNHELAKPIMVSVKYDANGLPRKYVLVDGYISYLILKFNNVQTIPIQYCTSESKDFTKKFEKKYSKNNMCGASERTGNALS